MTSDTKIEFLNDFLESFFQEACDDTESMLYRYKQGQILSYLNRVQMNNNQGH